MTKRIISLIVLTFAFLFFTTCSINTNQETSGSLVLRFPMETGKTLVPSISMEPALYNISGTGSAGGSFSISSIDTSAEISNLKFGSWTIAVDAKNGSGDVIGHGTAEAVVHTGEITFVTIVVTPLSGTGTLDLAVNWNAEDTEYPAIESELIPAAGVAITLPFTITGGNTGTFTGTDFGTGYYALILKLFDGNPAVIDPIRTMGAVEVVRIVKDQITAGVFDFTRINKAGGSIAVNIEPEMALPIPVTISGQLDIIEEDESMTVTASVPSEVGNVIYVWYINGEPRAAGNSFIISGLLPGVYRLDVTAFSVDGKRAGSATHPFDVTEATYILTIDIPRKGLARLFPNDVELGPGTHEFVFNKGSAVTVNAFHTGTELDTVKFALGLPNHVCGIFGTWLLNGVDYPASEINFTIDNSTTLTACYTYKAAVQNDFYEYGTEAIQMWQLLEYYPDGNAKKVEQYLQAMGFINSETFSYDENELLTRIDYVNSPQGYTHAVYEYLNDSGKIAYLTYYTNETIILINEYIYNIDQIERVNHFDAAYVLSGHDLYYYNSGKIIEIRKFAANNELTAYTLYTYNPGGKVTGIYDYDEEDIQTGFFTIAYDAYGFMEAWELLGTVPYGYHYEMETTLSDFIMQD